MENIEMVKGIVLAKGERVIRQYEATKLDSPKTDGHLIATNRRIIFTGEAKSMTGLSIMNREIQIDKVTGVQAFFGKGMNTSVILMATVLGLISFMLLFAFLPLGLIGLGLVGYMIYRMIKSPGNQMQMVITADNQSASGISVQATAVGFLGGIMNRFGGSHADMAINAGPARETEKMIRELGALVLDIQAHGEHAASRWTDDYINDSSEMSNKEAAVSVEPGAAAKQENSNKDFFS